MGANDRLQVMQAALVKSGVRDVKFCFSLGLNAIPSSTVARDTVDFLDAYQKGRYKVVDRIGDAPLAP